MSEKYKNFEDFLQSKHADQCEGVLDDDMSDDYENWITNLDVQDMQDYGEEWGERRYLDGKEFVLDGMRPSIEMASKIIAGADFSEDIKNLQNL